MAKGEITIKEELSKKVNAQGKSEILVRVTLSREDKPRFKTGVFVNPDEFGEDEESTEKYLRFCSSLKRIVREGHRLVEEGYYNGSINKEFIERVFAMFQNGTLYKGGSKKEILKDLTKVTYLDLESSFAEEQKVQEEEKKKEELSQRKTIYDYIKIYCEVKKLSAHRVQTYQVLERMMARYEQYQRIVEKNPFVWDYDTMTKDDIISFEKFLKDEHSLETAHPKAFVRIKAIVDEQHPVKRKRIATEISNRSDNHIIGCMSRFRAVMKYLFKNHLTNNSPFVEVERGEEKYGVPYFLTVEERNKIYDLDLSSNPSLEAQKDIFVFQCLVACRVGDLIKLKPNNIVNGVLTYEPTKTTRQKNPVVPRVPLSEKALFIVEKYKNDERKGDKLLPFISPQKYNDAIKKLIELAEITRNVPWFNVKTNRTEMRPIAEVASSHMARRTFIGNAYTKTQDVEVISSMSGHAKGSKAFARYRDISDDIRKNVVDSID